MTLSIDKVKEPDRNRTVVSGLYILGDLTINYPEWLVTVAGRWVQLAATEHDPLFDVLENADARPMRPIVSNLRRKLGDDANNPTYILNEPRVGYRMAKGRRRSRRRCNHHGAVVYYSMAS